MSVLRGVGRPARFQSESAKKRSKASKSRITRLHTVNIRSHITEWRLIGEENCLKGDDQVAEFLIECYRVNERRRKKRRLTSTPAVGESCDLSSAGVSSVASDKESMMSGFEKLSGTSQSETEERRRPGMQPQTKPRFQPDNRSATISFQDAGEIRDKDDDTYDNVLDQWDVSISVIDSDVPDVDHDDIIEEQALDMSVHDIEDMGSHDADIPEQLKVVGTPTKEDVDDQMYLVTHNALLQLARQVPVPQCRKCGKYATIDVRKRGSGAILKWTCDEQHTCHSWTSQQILRHGVLLGNMKLLSGILLSGNSYQKIAVLGKFINLNVPSRSLFDRVQGHYVVPAVDSYWTTVKTTTQQDMHEKRVIIAGDGRMDSPGYCAKYCTYVVMEQESKKIVAMEVVDKRECELKSPVMEAAGFKRAVADLRRGGVTIQEIVTDAHPQISSIMRKNYPEIRHSWDMWHGAKNLGKKLCAASQEKGKSGLKQWISPVTNHFFHSAETCHGDDQLLKAKFASVLNHVCDRHSWALGQCDHGELDPADRTKEWLSPHGPEIKALEKVVMDTRFQSNLRHYVTCQTTSELESFNNHILMYAPKRQAFSYSVYKCRCQLAAVDYMMHVDRAYKKNKKGQPCYNRRYSKAANHWSVKRVKVSKDYRYIPDLMSDIVNRFSAGEDKIRAPVEKPTSDPSHIAKTIAPVPPPLTKELVEAQKSRLTSWSLPTTSTTT